MRHTAVSDLSACLVDEYSGGPRQRVWVALVLAQQTPVILLDEPTTWPCSITSTTPAGTPISSW